MPLAKEVAELASPPAGEDEYGHEVVDVANGAAAAAFLAAGHGVIDVAAMLGLRVDAPRVDRGRHGRPPLLHAGAARLRAGYRVGSRWLGV